MRAYEPISRVRRVNCCDAILPHICEHLVLSQTLFIANDGGTLSWVVPCAAQGRRALRMDRDGPICREFSSFFNMLPVRRRKTTRVRYLVKIQLTRKAVVVVVGSNRVRVEEPQSDRAPRRHEWFVCLWKSYYTSTDFSIMSLCTITAIYNCNTLENVRERG